MKKILPVLVSLALVSPAWAQTAPSVPYVSSSDSSPGALNQTIANVNTALRVVSQVPYAPGVYTGAVATRGQIPNVLNTSNHQLMARSMHIARQNLTSFNVVVPNFYATTGGESILLSLIHI